MKQSLLVLILFGGIVVLVSGIVTLVEGIFALRAAKDASKGKPYWVISLIAVIFAAITVVTGLGDGASKIVSNLCTLAVDGFQLYLAGIIKNAGK